MRTKTLTIDGNGTMVKVKLDLHNGKYKATQCVSIYPADGMLKVYVQGHKVIEIPIKTEVEE